MIPLFLLSLEFQNMELQHTSSVHGQEETLAIELLSALLWLLLL